MGVIRFAHGDCNSVLRQRERTAASVADLCASDAVERHTCRSDGRVDCSSRRYMEAEGRHTCEL